MENNNDLEDNIKIEPINSSQLSYVTPKEQVNQVSMMADSINSMMDQYVLIKGLALNSTITSSPFYVDEDNIINIQLPYDSNRLVESDLWDGNFHCFIIQVT